MDFGCEERAAEWPGTWGTWKVYFDTTCLLGLRAGKWMAFSGMLVFWGVSVGCWQPFIDSFLCMLFASIAAAGLGVALFEDGHGVSVWILMGGICCPLIKAGPWGVPVPRWLILHGLPFMVISVRERLKVLRLSTEFVNPTRVNESSINYPYIREYPVKWTNTHL